MKKSIISFLLFISVSGLVISSCSTSKIVEVNSRLTRIPSSTKKHFNKIHPNGFWAGGKYIYL